MTGRMVLMLLLLGLIGPVGPGAALAEETAEAAEQAEQAEPRPYLPSDDPMADVDATIARAAASGKMAMIVLGANWCHDSRGLAKHFEAPAMAALLDDAYQLQYIDVGLFEHGEDIIRRFGMPVIYGTPTVLIIDPATGRLINADNQYRSDMHQWRDADSISAADTLAYFTVMAAEGAQVSGMVSAPSPALVALYTRIDAFEAAQAERIYRGYEFLRPLMAIEKKDRPKTFMGYWVELRGLRYTITGDLARLRNAARIRIAAGDTDIELAYPEYAKFSWE